MSSVVKENEVLTAVPETATPRPVASSTAAPVGDSASRPQPVAMEVPVTVNGARAVSGSEKREPFSESTKTVLIFGHGAVVRLSSSVAAGQLLFLTNEKTKKEVVCQVVKSKKYQSTSGYVELEFTEAVAGFWGIRFPAEAGPSQPVKQVSQTPSPVSSTPASSGADVASDSKSHSTYPVPSVIAPLQSVPAEKNSAVEPPSVSKPQASASVVEISKAKIATPPATISAVKSSATQTKSILDEEEVKIPSWLEPLARNAAIASASSAPLVEPQVAEVADIEEYVPEVKDLSLTEVADTPVVARPQIPPPTFGTHFLADGDALGAETPAKSSKKGLYVAIAAGALLLIGAGAWYMQQQAGSSETTNAPAAAIAPVSSSSNSSNAAQTPSQPSPASSSSSDASGSYTATSTPASAGISPAVLGGKSGDAGNVSTNLNKRMATVDSPFSPAPAQPKKPSLGSISLSAPVLNRPANSPVRAEEGLSFETASQAGLGEGLAAGFVSSSKQPVAPAAPLPVGGDVKSARLISSTAPVYPTIARAQRISGDVKIDALVEANGVVSSMKVVAGPPLLQQSAMEAVRHWRYQPAQLDGKAVPMHLTVTVQFKLQ